MEITKKIFEAPEYEFLRTNENLNKKIILLGLGGSHAYGTNVADSDIDIRGIAVNSPRNTLLGKSFDTIINPETDTTIYALDKMISLLRACNPNTIEILGLKNEHYLQKNEFGELLLANKELFLSKLTINAFLGYSTAQIRRLENSTIDKLEQARVEKHLLESMDLAMTTFAEKYPSIGNKLSLYIKDAITNNLDKEIFVDTELNGVPIRELINISNELAVIVRDYEKLGKRNKNAISRNKLGKHQMHTIRLYYMGLDILEKGLIKTYRDDPAEHELYMKLRNNEFLTDDGIATEGFYDLLNDLKTRFEYAKIHTELPDHPNDEKINDLVVYINKRVVRGEIEE